MDRWVDGWMRKNEKEGLSLFQARDSIRNSVDADARNNPLTPPQMVLFWFWEL